jgi:uncharacterized damage-inducible protein DinB
MAIRDDVVPEYEREIAITARLLDAGATLLASWKPHARSRTIIELASHVADVPAWGSRILGGLEFDLATLESARDDDTYTAIRQRFDAHAAATRRLLEMSDAEWRALWCLTRGGDELYAMPRTTAFRRLVLNHLIHHRGQLSVYLRMLGAVVPTIYGDTADAPFRM